MPGTTVGKQMNQGYPGTYSRNGDCIITPRIVTPGDASGPAFGAAVVLVQDSTGGTWTDAAVAMAAGHTPVVTQGANYAFAGFAVREVATLESFSGIPGQLTPLVQKYGVGLPADVIERGSVSVIVKDPQSAGYKANGKVFLRLVANLGGVPGDLETAADGGNTIQVPNCYLQTGIVDANSVCEVTLLSRNTV